MFSVRWMRRRSTG